MTARGAGVALLGTALCSLITASADASEPRRPPLAEPIFAESVTDIDGYEPGEVEFALNASTSASRQHGARILQSSIEVEAKLWSDLGIRLEPTFASERIAGESTSNERFGFRAAAGWGLLHDRAHDFHLQIEGAARLREDATDPLRTQIGESPLPYNLDLRAAVRVSGLTVRASVGVGVGDTAAHVPLRGQLALLRPWTGDVRFGFYGLELDVDGARPQPFAIAPNVWADATTLGIPGRLGVAVPILLGAPGDAPSVGLFVRLLVLTDREVEMESERR